jgi:hypothetical protein
MADTNTPPQMPGPDPALKLLDRFPYDIGGNRMKS